MLSCLVKYVRERQFFNEIAIFWKLISLFVLFQIPITAPVLTSQWKIMLFWKCLYQHFNIKWLFYVANEVRIIATDSPRLWA